MDLRFNKVILLLTATVNPKGTSNTKLLNPLVRELQYIEAILFYLENTDNKIVVCENTEFDFRKKIKINQKDMKRIEFLSFKGNDYEKNKGKGYGEAQIIKYAIENSNLIHSSATIIKITGRIKVKNIREIIESTNRQKEESIGIEFWGKSWIQSVCFVSSVEWLLDMVKNFSEKLDDRSFNFQRMLYEKILNTSEINFFYIYPILEGISGKTNLPYNNNILLQRKIDNYTGLKEFYFVKNKFLYYSYFSIKLFLINVYKKFSKIIK